MNLDPIQDLYVYVSWNTNHLKDGIDSTFHTTKKQKTRI